MRIFNQITARLSTVALASVLSLTYVQAQDTKTDSEGSDKEEGNRNVMLNASSANGVRYRSDCLRLT